MSENENSCVHGVGVSQCHYCSGASVTPSMMFAAQIIDLTAERDALKVENEHLRLAVEGLKEESRELRATIERTREEVQSHHHPLPRGKSEHGPTCGQCRTLAIIDGVLHLEDGKEIDNA